MDKQREAESGCSLGGRATATLVITARGEHTFTPTERRTLRSLGIVRFHSQAEEMTADEFVDLAGPYPVVAMTRRPMKYLHRDTLSRLRNLEALVVHTTGTHWIDEQYLVDRGVAMLSLGGYATTTVAEQTLASMLAMSRRFHLSADRSRHLIDESVSLRGFELRGRTVGLVGFGRLGRAVHGLVTALGMATVVHDPAYPGTASLHDVLTAADMIVMAASHRYGRPPVIGRAEIAATSARYLINASCDELVDHHAVVDALIAGDLDGYVVDEFDPVLSDPRIEPGRVVQTMHTGWYSDEAMARGRGEWVDQMVRAHRLLASSPDRAASHAA
jgi:phosphoglycerate dehydrogenase-like enzyme